MPCHRDPHRRGEESDWKVIPTTVARCLGTKSGTQRSAKHMPQADRPDRAPAALDGLALTAAPSPHCAPDHFVALGTEGRHPDLLADIRERNRAAKRGPVLRLPRACCRCPTASEDPLNIPVSPHTANSCRHKMSRICACPARCTDVCECELECRNSKRL